MQECCCSYSVEGDSVDIRNCRVLVTGASRGIGRGIAHALACQGCLVYGTSRRPDAIPLGERVQGIRYLPLELSDPDSIRRLVKDVNPVDILVNNAGVSQIGSVEDVSFDQLRYIVDVNLLGQIHLTKLLLAEMRKRRHGFIVNITSFAASIAIPFSTIYSVTKHGIAGLSKGLRQELKSHGVQVVSIAPVHIRTAIPMIETFDGASAYAEETYRVKKMRDKGMSEAPTPDWLSRKILRIIKSRKPRPAYIIGKNSWLYVVLLKTLPEAAIQWIVRKTFRVDG